MPSGDTCPEYNQFAGLPAPFGLAIRLHDPCPARKSIPFFAPAVVKKNPTYARGFMWTSTRTARPFENVVEDQRLSMDGKLLPRQYTPYRMLPSLPQRCSSYRER
jgi:hypothetical protein